MITRLSEWHWYTGLGFPLVYTAFVDSVVTTLSCNTIKYQINPGKFSGYIQYAIIRASVLLAMFSPHDMSPAAV